MMTMKNNKAGKDQLAAVILKYGSNQLYETAPYYVRTCLLASWTGSFAHSRGITLPYSAYKICTVFCSTDLVVDEYQTGFREGRSMTDQMFNPKKKT